MAFRKIDIDQFDEDKLVEEELYDPYPLAPAQAASRAKEVEREVRGLLTRCGGAEGGIGAEALQGRYGERAESGAGGRAVRIATCRCQSELD